MNAADGDRFSTNDRKSPIYMLKTAEDVAPRLNLRKQRLYELVRQDFFPRGVVIRLGRQLRFNEKRLIEFLENGVEGPVTAHRGQ